MKIITTVQELRQYINELTGQSIGFVPTMGALHEGHGALMKQAKKQNDRVIVSIFVNPTQFGPNEDLDRYPRDLDADRQFCEKLQVDAIFAPSVEEIYGKDGGITFDPGAAADILCGINRPGHFNGVLQIVAKLFMLVTPTRAYFGQKDAQQLALIEMLVRDYYFPIEIVAVPIVREADGLAKSSRNVNLTEKDRQEAVVLSRALAKAKTAILAGEDVTQVLALASEEISKTSAKVEYLELLNYPDLTPATAESEQILLAVAAHFTNVRLIDNNIFSKA